MSSSNTLSEQFIQEKAINFLDRYYRGSSANGRVFAQAEVRTISKKRADGLVAWRQLLGGVGVASLEAKSAKTLSALVKSLDEVKIKKDSTWLTVVIVFMGAYIAWDRGLRQYLDPFWVLVLYGVLFSLIPYIQKFLQGIRLPFHHRIAVLEQLLQYPSNEPWVAIGTDSINSGQFTLLRKACQKKRLGLLLVDKNGKVQIETRPRYNYAFPKKDYLVYYEKGEDIRREVKKGSNWKLWTILGTSSQLRANIYHFGLALAGFVAVYGAINLSPSPSPESEPLKKETPEAKKEKDAFAFLDTLREEMDTKATGEQGKPQQQTDCDQSILGPKYIIKDQLFNSEAAAKKRVAVLKAAGFEDSNYLWLPCYKNALKKEAFCVYPFYPRASQENVLVQLRTFLETSMEKGLPVDNPRILLVELK